MTSPRLIPFKVRIGLLIVLILFVLLGIIYFSNNWSALGAGIANPLRSIIGNQGVASLETFLFNLQDRVNQWEYNSGRKQPAAPWQIDDSGLSLGASATPVPSPIVGNQIVDSTTLEGEQTPVITTIASAPSPTATLAVTQDTPEEAPTEEPTPTSTPILTEWMPEPVTPFGTVDGEGVWSAYIQDATGRTVAARTFLQPDMERPFAYVAVVAFDLTAVRLNFVIGFDEPSLKGGPKGKGVISPEDFQAEVLLAVFNGGFQSTHGEYGAMQDGFVPLPPKDNAATVAVYQEGDVRLGEWGTEIVESADMVAYRQNCTMVVHNGEISQRVFNNSTADWGGTIDNQIVTWRSGLGISEDGQTLYYYVGPSLSMPSLADAMLASGAYQSMLLDINAFWVFFAAIHEKEGSLLPEPLLPEVMKHNIERFLHPFPRDFFYITSVWRE
jgi:hypothetical protein